MLAQFAVANNMPTGERAKQERMYRAKRRAREAETNQARNTRVAEDRAIHSHARANESPETSRAKRQRMREAKRSEREVQLDPARDGRLSVDRASHQEMQRVRLEQERHGTRVRARTEQYLTLSMSSMLTLWCLGVERGEERILLQLR